MFSLGFIKIAYDGTNNQGLEFKHSDTNNSTANVGPGGMTPQGLESYQPEQKMLVSKKQKAKAMTEQETAQFLLAKSAKVQKHVGGSSTAGAKGVSEGLKKDSETTNSTFEDLFASIKADREAHSNYIKAGLK